MVTSLPATARRSVVKEPNSGSPCRTEGHGQPDAEPGQPGRLGVVDRWGPDRRRSTRQFQRQLSPDLRVLGRSARRPTRPSRPTPGPSPTQCEFGGESTTPRPPSPSGDAVGIRVLAGAGPVGVEHIRPVDSAPPVHVDRAPSRATRTSATTRTRTGTTWSSRSTPSTGRSSASRPTTTTTTTRLAPRRSGSTPTSASTPRTRSTSPAPTPTAPASSCSRWRPGSRRRASAAASTSSRSPAGAPPPRSAGWWWCPAARQHQENPSGDSTTRSVVTSPLTPAAWANRIAIPLCFNPVGSSCSINAASEGIEGNELAGVGGGELAAGALRPAGRHLLQLSRELRRPGPSEPGPSPTYGSVGMSVFSDPIDPAETSPTNPRGVCPAHPVRGGGGVQHRTGAGRRTARTGPTSAVGRDPDGEHQSHAPAGGQAADPVLQSARSRT